MAPSPVHLVFDNSTNPLVGSGTVPPDPASGGLLDLGSLCKPSLPSTPPPGTIWIGRGYWTNRVTAAAGAAQQGVKYYTPSKAYAKGIGNGDGVVPAYSGAVTGGEDHTGVGGVAPLPPDDQRHTTWPVPLVLGPGQILRLINRLCQGGQAMFHGEADQVPLGTGQSIVSVGAAISGTGEDEGDLNLLSLADYPEDTVPDGYVLIPLAASTQDHTGSAPRLTTRILEMRDSLGQTYSQVTKLVPQDPTDPNSPLVRTELRPHVPNNNAIGGYLPTGTAPGPYSQWKGDGSFVWKAGDYPRIHPDLPEGDNGTAYLIALLQPATSPLPWTLPPLSTT